MSASSPAPRAARSGSRPAPRARRLIVAAAALGVAGAAVGGVISVHCAPTRAAVAEGFPRASAVGQVLLPTPPTPKRNVHQYVAPAVPTRFTMTGHGFTIRATVCAMAPVFPLDPPGEQHHTVCWVTKGFGVRPGSNTGTSYVLGHSWAPDPAEVLNKASSRATRDILAARATKLDGITIRRAPSLLGTRIILRTANGVLVYRVGNAFGVDKHQLGYITSIMNPHVPRRVVLITCAERNGVDYPYNVVFDARLIASYRR